MVETVVGMSLLMVIAIGTIQIATLLYARNVIRSSAHEITRVAVERGAAESDAVAFGHGLVRDSLGRMLEDLDVEVTSTNAGTQRIVTAYIEAVVEPAGPLPVTVPVSSVVHLRAPAEPR